MKPDKFAVRHYLWPYSGSKWRMCQRLYDLFPSHKRFVDVFGGTGIVLARKSPSVDEVYCDLDWHCRNALTVVKHEGGCNALVQRLQQTRRDRDQYFECKRLLKNPDAGAITRAWAFLVCGAIGYTGHPAIRNSWLPLHRQKKRLTWLPEEVARWHKRLSKVAILNLSWKKTLAHFDSIDTLFFLDPPYPESVVKSRLHEYYFHSMTTKDHIALLEALQRIRGHAVLCGYNHPLYTERLFHWQKFSFRARNSKQNSRQEQVWRNFDEHGRKIVNDPDWITSRFIEMMGGTEAAEVLLKHTNQLMNVPVLAGGHDRG